jgi:hypothetical protein
VNLELFAADLTRLWVSEFAVFFIPASIIGAGISWVVGRWYPCPILSYAAAIAFVNSPHLASRLHDPLSLTKLLGYSAVAVLPPILIAASAGYFAARVIKKRVRHTKRA